jgi:hypothetical protein
MGHKKNKKQVSQAEINKPEGVVEAQLDGADVQIASAESKKAELNKVEIAVDKAIKDLDELIQDSAVMDSSEPNPSSETAGTEKPESMAGKGKKFSFEFRVITPDSKTKELVLIEVEAETEDAGMQLAADEIKKQLKPDYSFSYTGTFSKS